MRVGFDSSRVEFVVACEECREVGHTLGESNRRVGGRTGRSYGGASGVESEEPGVE